MSTLEKVRAELRAIAFDASDGEQFDQAAAIARLAEIMQSLLPQGEPERDPVPFVDYLPDPGGAE